MYIGSGVEFIHDYFFCYIPNLKKVVVSENNCYFKSVDNDIYSKNGEILMFYPQSLTSTSYEIHSGTKKLGRKAFWANEKLESLKIPASVTVIPLDTFF